MGEDLSPIALCRALFLLFPALSCWSALECWLYSILWLLQLWVYWKASCDYGVLLLATWFAGLCLGLLWVTRVLMQCWFANLCFNG
ncbi:hypothetical protein NC651_021353 [Populus alba x Populus x berolinensis]|nr:hypothetical protein NC651_021353 [Populus alba x Populus x berolinensis]